MRYIFYGYILDTRRYELRRAGVPIPLRPKVFHLLAYLLAHRERVVPRQELCEHLWPHQFVSDATLDACLAQARQAVGDRGRTQHIIQTRHGYGYRFVAAVEVHDHPAGEDDGRSPSPPSHESARIEPTRGRASTAVIPTLVPEVPGDPLVPLTPLLSPPSRALAGERKVVTALVCTLEHVATWTQRLEAEALHQRMQGFFALILEVVGRYGGMLQRVLDDGVLVLFGAPMAQEDHAQRAVLAALELQQRLSPSGTDSAWPLEELVVRMGLHMGQILIGPLGGDGRLTFTPVGDTTHRAVRLAQQAAPGAILLSDAMARLVQGVVRLAALEPVPLAGAPAPDTAYRVLGRHAQRQALLPRETRVLTPFIGRERELAALHALVSQVEEGRGQVVGIIGEPGLGKSRLCDEVSQAHRTHGWLILETSADSYGQATPYLPIIDLLKRYFEITARDDLPHIRDQVSQKLLSLEQALGPALPALLALLDAPVEDQAWQVLESSQRRQRTLQALKQLLLCASQGQPLLVVVENLHWIDTETQAVLDTLVESLPTARLLLLATYRPEYQHGWGSKTAYTQLRLDPLPREQAQVFLDVLLGDGSGLQPLKQQVIALTQGNPFFLEESVQSLIETGGLGGARGAYRLGHPLQTLRVPATVQAVLAARIDRLPSQEKQLLQTAAVIGHEVPFPVLRAIAELSDEDLSRSLSHLQAAEFLYETRLFPQHEFTFKHALTQQVAYETLLQEGRRARHARVVAALEALAGDRVAEQVQRLAHHAFQGEIWDKAVAYFRQAGDKALARSAFREAVTFFEQALVALKHLPGSQDAREQAVDLHLDLHHALSPLEEYGRFFDHLREAEILAEALDDQRRLGLVLASMCSAFRVVQGDHDRAIECGQRALAIATAVGEFGLKVVSNHFLGQTYRSLGDYRRAMEHLRMAAASLEGNLICEPLGLGGPVYVASLNYLVWCLADLGEFAEGIASAEEAVRVAEVLDQPEGLLLAYRGVGYLYLVKGDLHKAISMLERGLALCQAGDLPGYVPWTASSLGYAYALSGRIAEAIPLLEQAVQRPTSTGKVGHAVRVAYLGEAYLVAGRIDEAIELALHALEFSREHKERGHQVYALRLLGEIGARRGPPESDQAGGYYRQALALADALGMRPLVAHCHLGLGRLYAQIGRRERACAELSTAIGLYRAMDMTFWLPQAEAALTQVGSSLALPSHLKRGRSSESE